MLAEQPPGGPGVDLPTFVYGDRLTGRPDLETTVDGNAELRRGASSIRADRIEYDQPADLVKARGNVRVNSGGNLYNGPELEIKLDTFEGLHRLWVTLGIQDLSNRFEVGNECLFLLRSHIGCCSHGLLLS